MTIHSHPTPAAATAPAALVAGPTPTAVATGTLFAALDATKLDCYNVALEFQLVSARLLPKAHPVLRDQLERASVSIVLNIAEGAGRRSRRDKARFYTMARGSAMECAAVLDVLYLRGLADAADYRRGHALLVRVVQMLSKLQARLA